MLGNDMKAKEKKLAMSCVQNIILKQYIKWFGF